MDDNIHISVILPIYNVEKYIERCIISLKKQKQDGLEFIFVDDCSNDNTMNIINQYASNDDRFIIIKNNKNLGRGKCRNIGIENARGEYLSFIDPDDYICDDFYAKLYEKTKRSKSDFTKGRRIKIDNSNNLCKSKINYKIVNGLKKNIPLYYLIRSEHTTALYKKSFIDKYNIRYGNSKSSEDKTFLLRLCLQEPSISFENSAIYYYCSREQSITNDFSHQRCTYELDALEEIIKEISKTDDLYKFKYCQDVIKHIFKIYSNVPNIDKDSDILSRLKTLILNIPDYESLTEDFVELGILLNDNHFIPLKNSANYIQTIQKWVEYLSIKKSCNYLQYFSYILTFIIVRNILKNKNINISQIKNQLSKLNKKDRMQIYRYIPLNAVKLFCKGVVYLFNNFIHIPFHF